jgi:tetratricopeptide (TPR) repeat protein
MRRGEGEFRMTECRGSAAARPLQWAAVLALLACCGCTPQQALLMSVIPDGTASILLSHFQDEEVGNRERIAELEGSKDWDGLAQFAEANVKKDKNNANWWLVAGYAHSEAGRRDRAIECYGEMVRLAPDDMLGWSLLAKSYRETRQPLRAVNALNNAHLVRQGTAETYFLLGESYSDLDRDLPAAAAYREAVQLDTNLSRAWFGLGRASARLGRAADFDSALQSLSRLDPALAKELAELRPARR